ncbi:ATP-grasp domain-containing protein [Streptomyces sp. bgisy034]|uniref:ATP-grasp domain-containing protein n=1 Tax=Streptomyces sp. bgisy034 TaxID=3413774 RepID=UPI003EB84E8B
MTESPRGPVLLIGADPYVLRACEEHGIEAIVLYGSYLRDSGLPKLPDCVTPVFAENHQDPESVLAALHRRGLGRIQPAGVYTSVEFAVTDAAVLASVYDCVSVDPHTMIALRDKSVQKRLIREAGIPVADLHVIEDIHQLSGDFALPFDRGVLKPIAGGSTALTSTVTCLSDVVEASRRYRERKTSWRTFAYESFVSGEEWFVDGYVVDGKPVFWSLGTYNEPCLSLIENAVAPVMRRFDPSEDTDRFALARPVVEAALQALGLKQSVFHMELFHDLETGRIAFGECAARRGGGLVQEEVHCKFGVDLAAAGLLCAIGRNPEQQVSVRPDVIGTALFSPQPGTLLDSPTAAEMLQFPGVEFATMEMPIGTTPGTRDTSTHQGAVLLAAPSVTEFDKRVAEVRSWYAERTTVLPPSLRKEELKQWQRRIWPDRDFDNPLYTPALDGQC